MFDGRVAVVQRASASADYGADEYFFVPDGEAPQRWLVPPLFLSDSPAGRAVGAKAPRDLTIAQVPEIDGCSRRPSLPDAAVHLHGDRGPQPRHAVRRRKRSSSAPTATRSSSTRRRIRRSRSRRTATAQLTSFVNGNLTANLGSASLVDTGSDGSAAGLNWGRWQGQGSTIVQKLPDGSTVNNDGGNLHYIYGNAALSLPTSGQVTYAPVGGTRPTDSATGATGTLISAGTINVDFNHAQVALSGLAVGFTNATYTMGGTASIINGHFSTAGPGGNVGCTGSALPPLIAGNFAGFFAGPGGAASASTTTSTRAAAASSKAWPDIAGARRRAC